MAIDLNTLLAPVSDASPCGEDLLFSSDFDAIQHARRFDDPSLDQGEWVTEIKEADWNFVIERSTALLKSQTKDLRLAAWLTEALAIEDGLPGLAQGYALLAGLSERYWDHLHPLPEGDDAEYRLGNVAWLIGRTAQLLREVPLAQAPGGAPFTALDMEVATHVAQAVKRDPDHADDIARGKPSIEQIDAAKRSTPVAFYRSLLGDLTRFEVAMLALEKELDKRAGDSAPSFRQAKDAYEVVYRLAERFARELGVSAAEPVASPAQQADQMTHNEAGGRAEPTFKAPTQTQREEPMLNTTPQAAAGLQNRAQAVAQLRAVAKFFRATEPHSPVAYLADKAAEWADMPLHQWLETVVKDDGSLAHLRELLGVKAE
ncbi:type VI secretion system protein TssA [Trinickia violacea]|uniref:Type VI secretion system protein TssA n=1 Tax=Trinickia violacea TaxID=2571746 RepID=A0A4P8IVQ4_9BURK|nr:type VI secretion system protein TssA [Trinickia violacea]QCP52327.1 type VI secretion system protein TssA [Trinickia violacea]